MRTIRIVNLGDKLWCFRRLVSKFRHVFMELKRYNLKCKQLFSGASNGLDDLEAIVRQRLERLTDSSCTISSLITGWEMSVRQAYTAANWWNEIGSHRCELLLKSKNFDIQWQLSVNSCSYRWEARSNASVLQVRFRESNRCYFFATCPWRLGISTASYFSLNNIFFVRSLTSMFCQDNMHSLQFFSELTRCLHANQTPPLKDLLNSIYAQ